MKVLSTLLLVLILSSIFGCSTEEPQSEQPEEFYLNTKPEVSYVGIDACKDCHLPQYETFMKTGMGRSFRPATVSNSDADFIKARPVYDEKNDLYYRPFHQGEQLFLEEYRLVGRDTVHRRVEQIDYIVGSGHHTNSHIREENGYLYQIPLTFYTQSGKWDLPPGFEANNTRFNRPIQLECMTCHNARPTFVGNSENRFSRVPHGIDCEQCHGPGALHVEAMNTGQLVDTSLTVDRTIVNPRRLPANLQFNVCQRCHMQGAAILKDGKSFLDFRPGTSLSEVTNVFWPRYPDSVRHFIMASHPDRLQMSACFRQTWKVEARADSLTCVTCHSPHQEVTREDYNQTCRSCHGSPEFFCKEAERVREEKGNDCVACHMPFSPTLDIPHVRITDHFVRVPESGTVVSADVNKMKDFLGLSSLSDERRSFVNLASLIEKNPSEKDLVTGYLTLYEQYAGNQNFLDSAAIHLNNLSMSGRYTKTELAPLLVRLWFLQGDFDSIRRIAEEMNLIQFQDSWTLYRAGEAFSKAGDPTRAIYYYREAVNIAPDHLRFQDKLGQAYLANGQFDQSVSIFSSLLQLDPTFTATYINRGFTLVQHGRLEAAERDFLKALTLDPNSREALANLASLYYNLEEYDEAEKYLSRLLKLDPANPDYQMLKRLLSRSGD